MSTSANRARRLLAAAAAPLLAGCSLAPAYVRPSVPAAPAYKEAGPGGAAWISAKPADASIRGDWWRLFGDEELDGFELEASSCNLTVAAAASAFAAARAVVREARAGYYPAVSGAASASRQRVAPELPGLPVATYPELALPFDASWTPDLWGRVRNSVKAAEASAQSSAADLENTRLLVESELAVDYFELRGQDSLKLLLDETAAADREALSLTRSLARAGLDSDEAVAQAEAQLKAVEAQDESAGIARAQYEHAIAVLIGKAPESLSIPPKPLEDPEIDVPLGLPSELLQRRPDVAAAERAMAAANAQIGVAKAAYFPSLTLTGAAGFESLSPAQWLQWPARVWSVGGSLSETVFDAGLRSATVAQYRAQFDEAVANYRQTVLSAFQQVEDQLAARRLLERTLAEQGAAVRAARRNLKEAEARYRGGLDPYLNVLSARTALLADEQAALGYRTQRSTAVVQLIEALGGGWDVSRLPGPKPQD